MRRKIAKGFLLLLSFFLLCAPLDVLASAQDAAYQKIVLHNQTQCDRQITGDDALYSLVLPDYTDNIDSDSPSIITAAAAITKNCRTDYEKIKAVHDWTADNLYYDLDYYYGYTGGTYALASDVLKYRYAVCEGYSNLFTALLRSVGIPVKGVLGYSIAGGGKWSEELVSGPAGDLPNHKWNMVYCDDRWLILDVTWDSTNFRRGGVKTGGGGIVNDFFDLSIEKLSFEHKIIGLDVGTPFFNRDGGLKYTLCPDGTLSVTGLIAADAKKTVIPTYIGGKPVYEIAVGAFSGCGALQSVIVSTGISSIGDRAFFDCAALTKIYIPPSVTALGYLSVGYNQSGADVSAERSGVLTVYGASGSAAAHYAATAGLPFIDAYTKLKLSGGAELTALTPFSGQLTANCSSTAMYDDARSSFGARDLMAYRLSLGGGVVPDGFLSLSLPLPAGFNTSYVRLFRLDAAGNKTELPFSLKVGLLTFTDMASSADYVIAEVTDKPFLSGDIDDSGSITVTDARLALRATASLTALTPVRKAVADYDGVGSLTVLDARALLRTAAGIA